MVQFLWNFLVLPISIWYSNVWAWACNSLLTNTQETLVWTASKRSFLSIFLFIQIFNGIEREVFVNARLHILAEEIERFHLQWCKIFYTLPDGIALNFFFQLWNNILLFAFFTWSKIQWGLIISSYFKN